MQETRDIAGADLALVVGVRVLGVPRYRVVLMQAKHEHPDWWRQGNVGHKKGAQLSELLSSGMGYYLFYPKPMEDPALGRETRLMPVVRSAEAVFRDVAHSIIPGSRYRVNIYSDSDGRVDAMDFAQFLSVAMCGDTLDIGRLFPTVPSVADALGVPGRPLVPDIVAIDATGRLSCHELLEKLRGGGYDVEEEFRFPVMDSAKLYHDRAVDLTPRPL